MKKKYRHIKTGGIYTLLHTNVMDVTNGFLPETKVIYQAEHSKIIFSRKQSEFFDGRFEEVKE